LFPFDFAIGYSRYLHVFWRAELSSPMVLRYITSSGTNRKTTHSIQQQVDALLRNVVSVLDLKDHDNDYDALLQILHKYPSDVVSSCHDNMGNTILHMLFRHTTLRNTTDDKASNTMMENNHPAHKTNRWTSHRRARSYVDNDGNKQKATLLQVVHYLTHCSDVTSSIDGTNNYDDATLGSETRTRSITCNTTQSISLVRQKSASGSLPLHMACRCRYISVPQQIDVVQYLIDAYPYGIQCPDTWGNLPLHEACDVNSSNMLPPIELIILLVQMYPESIRIQNMDGNLPLHLVAGMTHKTLSMLRNIDGTSESTNDKMESDMEEYPMKGKTSTGGTNGKSESSYEYRQLEIVEYLVGYWPESIHITNHMHQTALHQAIAADINISMIQFLQQMDQMIDPPSCPPCSTTSTTAVHNISYEQDNDDMNLNQTKIKGINPFDDDCETLNTTMNVSMLSAGSEIIPDVQFPSNILEMTHKVNNGDSENESETDFDGVVELAEDYFEVVVVDRSIDPDDISNDQNILHRNGMYGTVEGQRDLVFNNSGGTSYDNNNNFADESRFVSPF
jgi:hypothetical protein